MRSSSEPILNPRRRLVLTWLLGAPAIGASAWWALTPPRSTLPEAPDLGSMTLATNTVTPDEPFAATLFDAVLWTEPPAVAKAEPEAISLPPPPPPAPNLQLVGIIEDNSAEQASRSAALYDPDENLLHVAAVGDSIGRWRVGDVLADRVTLVDGTRTHTILLDETAAPSLPTRGGRP